MATGGFGWQITSQTHDQTVIDQANNVIVGAYIYFQTNAGNKGVVFVPNNLLTEQHVTATVRAQAKLIDSIGKLSENASQQ